MANPFVARSLHRRLSAALGSLALLVGLLGALGAYLVVHSLGNQFNDDLQEAAAAVRPTPAVPPTRPDGAPMPAKNVVVQVWGPGDGARPGHTSDPGVTLPRARPGFSSLEAGGKIWDAFALQAGDAYLLIAEQRSVRNANAWRVALWAALPVVALLPLLVLIVHITVRLSLRPLEQLGQRAARADLNHLQPLEDEEAPDELRPFLDSINRMMDRLSTLIEAERRFIANAAHELRTPITAMQLQVDNLRHATPADRGERLDELQRGIRRTASLISQLLGLARADMGGAQNAPQAVSLPQVVTDVIADLLPLAIDRGVDLGAERLDDISLVCAEADLRVLVKNLIDNAIRYGGAGGTGCRVDVSVLRQDASAVIEVADNGPGIPPADLARVFDRFFRGSASDEEGSGLGLSIAQTLAANHGGHVTLAGRPDGATGVVARIVLPIQ
ncbi:sensor histidine kinase [Cupriavidus sp. 30B13]|uniref:sensor histidine kinase n=1 Tax=Cupriavidus sp. 30B13 TaxID=3384241 RepID=UPI003B915218